MSYHQDWLMRQIEAIAATLALLVSGKKPDRTVVAQQEHTASGTNQLAIRLRALTVQGKICEAEDALFAAMEDADPEVPEAAVLFYREIARLSDTELEQANFSREEILEGLQAVCAHYGLDVFT